MEESDTGRPCVDYGLCCLICPTATHLLEAACGGRGWLTDTE